MDEEALFAAALERQSIAERQDFLNEACSGDAGLRRRMEQLLAMHEKAAGILERGTQAAVLPTEPTLTADLNFAGRFKLGRKLGEGGMGEVWEAYQTEPVQRLVALKVVRPGFDSARMLARFEQERQALALMDHPNIAKVLDAGVAESRPYFVMELIEGVPVTEYCDTARLSPRQRLELFLPVCHAVQHAHQKGIIHRDLKPSNILVTTYDGKPVPKVIDFGVAKATGPRLTEQSVHTEIGLLIGTLEYMSPEQAELNNLDVDTRSDVYALGAVLYELLTGSVPISRHELQSAGFGEVLRQIKEVDPPKPSTKLSGSVTLPSVAAVRQTEPKKLTALVRGELDWIVMKCLEKDRARRYETANGLAMDLQRYLADEPVAASPPSTVYRIKKFVRRNRGAVFAGSVILLLLVGGSIGTLIGLVQAKAAWKAEEARAENERAAKETAEKRLGQIEKGIDVLTAVFENLDPREEEKEGRPLRALLGDRLIKAAQQLDGEAVGDPVAVARLQTRLGKSMLNLGLPKPALELLLKAHKTLSSSLGHDHPDTLSTANNLGVCYRDDGQYVQAEQLHKETLALRTAKLGIDDPATLESMNNLAAVYRENKKVKLAIPLHEEALRLRKAKLGPRHPDTLVSMNNLAMSYHTAQKLDLALPLYEETLQLRQEVHGPNHRSTLTSMNNLALGYKAIGKRDLALRLQEETFQRRKATQGPDHPDTLAARSNLGLTYQGAGDTERALSLLEENLKFQKSKRAFDHPDVLQSMHSLATCYLAAKKLDLALPMLQEALRLRRVKLGDDNPRTLNTIDALGRCLFLMDKKDEALPLFQEASEGVAKLHFQHENADSIVNNLIEALEGSEQFAKAEVWRRKWLEFMKGKNGPESVAYADELGMLGANLHRQNKFVEAELLLRQCFDILQKKRPEFWPLYHVQSLLGASLMGQQKFAEAEPMLIQGYDGITKSKGAPPERREKALERLAQLYEAWGKPGEAAKRRQELKEISKQ